MIKILLRVARVEDAVELQAQEKVFKKEEIQKERIRKEKDRERKTPHKDR